jgi:hypothetical protein
MPVNIPTLSVAPSTIVARLAAGDLLDQAPIAVRSLMFDGVPITPATIAAGDLVIIQDLDDSLTLKTVTTQSIADLIGAGDVQGPAVATDDAITRYDGTTGKLIKDSVNSTINNNSHFRLLGVNAAIDMVERNTGPSFQAGRGHWWVRDDVPSVACFTDDVGNDFDLITNFATVNAALVTPDADILVNSALGDFNFIVGGDTNANLLNCDAGLDAVGIGAAPVSGSILTLNTTTSPLEFIESVFNAGLTTPAGTIAGYIAIEIGGNVLYVNAYSVIPS